jgi:hypothetical protein
MDRTSRRVRFKPLFHGDTARGRGVRRKEASFQGRRPPEGSVPMPQVPVRLRPTHRWKKPSFHGGRSPEAHSGVPHAPESARLRKEPSFHGRWFPESGPERRMCRYGFGRRTGGRNLRSIMAAGLLRRAALMHRMCRSDFGRLTGGRNLHSMAAPLWDTAWGADVPLRPGLTHRWKESSFQGAPLPEGARVAACFAPPQTGCPPEGTVIPPEPLSGRGSGRRMPRSASDRLSTGKNFCSGAPHYRGWF